MDDQAKQQLIDVIFGEHYPLIKALGIDSALRILTDKERFVIECRFDKRLTLRAIGMIMPTNSISPERVRQIEAKALRKLRHPRQKRIIKGIQEPIDPKSLTPAEQLKACGVSNFDIDDLELSIRPRNALFNAQIRTLEDLIDKKESDLLKLSNFGRKSLYEVCWVLEGLGLNLRGRKI